MFVFTLIVLILNKNWAFQKSLKKKHSNIDAKTVRFVEIAMLEKLERTKTQNGQETLNYVQNATKRNLERSFVQFARYFGMKKIPLWSFVTINVGNGSIKSVITIWLMRSLQSTLAKLNQTT